MEKDNKILQTVIQKFDEYLLAHKCRKTPERYAILELVYTEQQHFDMDSLYEAMNRRNFRVSRATLYNTMQLLLKCGLVQKHQFGKNLSFYERAYNNDFHHHLICISCHKVKEYRDDELKLTIQTKKIKQFAPSYYSLYIYGLCNICIRKLKKGNKQNKHPNK